MYDKKLRALYKSSNKKFKDKNYTGALSDLNEILAINPNHTDAQCEIGIVRSTLGDHKGAIEEFNKVLESNPNYDLAIYNIAREKEKLGEIDEAIEYYNKVLKISKNTHLLVYSRAAANSLSQGIKLVPKQIKI